jgi:outer membrane protein assembly factor BamB
MKKLHISRELIAMIVSVFLFFYIVICFSYYWPSFAEVGSFKAEIGNHYLTYPTYKTIQLNASPIVINNTLYIPVNFAAMADGISADDIYTDDKNLFLMINDRNDDKMIFIDGKEKTITINQKKYNLSGQIMIKNNAILISKDWLNKLFNINIIKNGNKITIEEFRWI